MKHSKATNIQLGVGLITLGRPWGYQEKAVPNEFEAMNFLAGAVKMGIDFFDTAPSYGLSEQRLGTFLSNQDSAVKKKITVATKFGENWDSKKNQPRVGHDRQSYIKSIDLSLKRLGKIDILQLHKTTPAVLRNSDLQYAIEYARSKGIQKFGASVSDVGAGLQVVEMDLFSVIQLPYNLQTDYMEKVLDQAVAKDMMILINRPLGMGQFVATVAETEKDFLIKKAFQHIIQKQFRGFILTGTQSLEHLRQNQQAFEQAKMT